jgi:hypothetical protein
MDCKVSLSITIHIALDPVLILIEMEFTGIPKIKGGRRLPDRRPSSFMSAPLRKQGKLEQCDRL